MVVHGQILVAYCAYCAGHKWRKHVSIKKVAVEERKALIRRAREERTVRDKEWRRGDLPSAEFYASLHARGVGDREGKKSKAWFKP